MEEKVVGKCLQAGALAHGEITNRAIWLQHHVFAPRHAMDPRFQGFRGLVERAARVPDIRSRARLETMVEVARGGVRLTFGIRQSDEGVTHGSPRQQGRSGFETQGLGACSFRDRAIPLADAMAIPIRPIAVLRPCQRITGMGRQRKMPGELQISAKADEKHALAPLRHAVIGGVREMNHDIVAKPLPRSRRLVPLQAREMVEPGFVTQDDVGMRHLQSDVFDVVHEGLACQALHVLEDEGFRPGFAKDANGLGKHVARIGVGIVLAADRERLTRRPARHEFDAPLVALEIDIANVPGRQRPARDGLDASRAVAPNGFAAIAVPLDDLDRLEPGERYAEAQATGAGEKFDRSHQGPSSSRRVVSSQAASLVWHSHKTTTFHPMASRRS